MARQVMWFLLPQDLEALISKTGEHRDHLPIYINPQSFDIKETKLINHTLSKGGYIVQYWGEELPIITVGGTTGSGGIEAINILRDIYRHEQLTMNRILIQRANDFASNSSNTLENSNSANSTSGVTATIDALFSGAATSIIEGTRSVVEEITQAFLGISDDTSKKTTLLPSLGAFAVSIDIFFQGVKYRGFFKDFSVQEKAESPGLFDYNFTFMVTRRTGRRNNFMPWHRNPLYSDGTPRSASVPTNGAATNELSIPTEADYGNTQEQMIGGRLKSSFNQTKEGLADINHVPINRRSKF